MWQSFSQVRSASFVRYHDDIGRRLYTDQSVNAATREIDQVEGVEDAIAIFAGFENQ